MLGVSIVLVSTLAFARGEKDDDRNFHGDFTTTPLVALAILGQEDSSNTESNVALGLRSGYDFLQGTRGFGIAGSISASYLGILGTERGGREWRVGFAAGPRLGTRHGGRNEVSLRVSTGLDFVNDTYRIDSRGDRARVPRASLIGVPFKIAAVLAVVDVEVGLSPQFFIDSQAGNDEKAPSERAPWDGQGDEFETSSAIGLRVVDRFRVGISQRTRWTSYGVQTFLGLGFAVGF
ncbi:MAG: hypothetical protein AAF602_01975 [Myxococcota bacterium]